MSMRAASTMMHQQDIHVKVEPRHKACSHRVGQLVQTLTKVIKARRRSLGISQEMLAETAGLDRGYLVSIEGAKRNPSIITLLQIAVALRIPASELIGLAEQMISGVD